MELPREYISYSQIRLYQSCPRKYYYTYIENLALPINEKVFLGVVFHSVIEKYFSEKIKGTILPIENLTELFRKEFDFKSEKQEIRWEIPKDDTRKRGVAFVNYFLRQVAPVIDPLMVEKELWADLPDMDVKLKGVLDLVETDFSITDFKTTTAKWSKARIRASYLQVIIYRYLFEKNFGDVIKRLKFKIIYSKNASSIKHQEILIDPRDVDFDYNRMLEIIRFVVDNIKQGVFEKNENFSCGFCEYKDICKKGQVTE